MVINLFLPYSVVLHLHPTDSASGSHRGETDSAANQFGAPESAEDPRGTLSVVLWPLAAVSRRVSDL